MLYFIATLHTAGVTLRDRLCSALEESSHGRNRERGASTLEMVFWAVALLALAGIVYAAIQSYINNKVAGIK